MVKRKLVSVCLEVVLISGQHRYTVCAECTVGMEIILGTADGTPRWKLVLVHLDVVLVSAQDRRMVCAECTSGMEIILGTTDGTPS